MDYRHVGEFENTFRSLAIDMHTLMVVKVFTLQNNVCRRER